MSDVYYALADIQIHGRESLRVYHFGDRMVNHYFCGTCGIYPFHDAATQPGHYRVNLGCLEGVDPFALSIRIIDGRSF